MIPETHTSPGAKPSKELIPPSFMLDILQMTDSGNNAIHSVGPNKGHEQKPFSSFVVIHRFRDKEIQFLVLKHTFENGQIQYKFSGGKSEINEKPIDTALREVEEEVLIPQKFLKALKVESLNNSGVFCYFPDTNNVLHRKIFFVALKPIENFDVDVSVKNYQKKKVETLWMSAKELDAEIYGDHRQAFKEAVEVLRNESEKHYYLLTAVA